MKDASRLLERFLFVAIAICLLLRIYEIIILLQNPFIDLSVIGFELLGFVDDMIPLSLLALVAGVFFVVSRFTRSLFSQYFVLLVLAVYCFLTLALQSYFTLLLYPVDKLIFNMPAKDVIETAVSSSDNIFVESIPYLIVSILIVTLFVLSKRVVTNRLYSITLGVLLLLAMVIRIVDFKGSQISSRVYYFASLNKLLMLGSYNDDVDEPKARVSITEAFASYKFLHPEHEFVSEEYPFLHRENYDNDVLRPYFAAFSQKPNVMIIITEALSRAYSGPGASIASCTPFIDSLAGRGLYWENCLSTAERTFEAFPSVLGSLPYGRQGFTVDGEMPYHLTMLNLLKHNGYQTSIFHASEFKLYGDNWWSFFIKNNVDTILDKSCFPALANFPCEWGLADESLFSHVSSMMEKENGKPRLDVLLTWSMHEPYSIPHAKQYQKELAQYIANTPGLSSRQRYIVNKNIKRYATAYYFDKQLRYFFDSLKKSPAFQNTIFIITGDHSFANLDPHNTIKQYHVPLVIYSPMVTKPARFHGLCSHLDIAPSILCLLKNACNLDLPQYTHWMGKMLDTSSSVHQPYHMPFISASKICKDYLAGNFYINGKKLYSCINLQTAIVEDDKKYAELFDNLSSFKVLNQYAYTRNRLVPDSIYQKYCSKSVVLLDTSMVSFAYTDSVSEFITLAKLRTKEHFKNFNISIVCDINCAENVPYIMPRLVISSSDLKDNSTLSYQIDLFKRGDWKPMERNTWQAVTSAQNTSMLNVHRDSTEVLAYLWNLNKSPTYYRNIRVVLKGELP